MEPASVSIIWNRDFIAVFENCGAENPKGVMKTIIW
jgi:hypothetical protein